MKVYLKYTFIFDTDSPWTHKDNFENDLSSYFISCGMEPQIVNGANEKDEEVIIYLEKTEVETLIEVKPKMDKVFTKPLEKLNAQPK